MRIIASDNDGFEFERAYIGAPWGFPVPIAVMGGVECNIDTKPGALQAGLAYCCPVDVRRAEDWPMSVRVERDGQEETIENMTADPKVVEAARKFAALDKEAQLAGAPL